MSDMSAAELGETVAYLGLDPADAAQLLGVAPRTMRRWLLEGEEIPGPAIVALRAWHAMHDRNMNWKPGAQTLFEEDRDQIDRYRKHIVEMDAALRRVEKRGGPKSPWAVDLNRSTAILGPFEVSFYRLKQTEDFSLSNYRRRDQMPDLARDMPFLEDAAYCIYKAIARARAATPALKKLASYTRNHSSSFATDGPKSLTAAQRVKRQQEIEGLADRIDELADEVAIGRGGYAQLEGILTKLHAAGFFPMMTDISAIAKAMA